MSVVALTPGRAAWVWVSGDYQSWGISIFGLFLEGARRRWSYLEFVMVQSCTWGRNTILQWAFQPALPEYYISFAKESVQLLDFHPAPSCFCFLPVFIHIHNKIPPSVFPLDFPSALAAFWTLKPWSSAIPCYLSSYCNLYWNLGIELWKYNKATAMVRNLKLKEQL